MVYSCFGFSQHISDFTSVEPVANSEQFVFPSTHTFQKIIESGDPIDVGGTMPGRNDFTGYVPINGASDNGYLSINKEDSTIGGVTILDIQLNDIAGLWETTFSEVVDFTSVVGTRRNCSGTVTPWETIISSEEIRTNNDDNGDGYRDYGWNVEIDPQTKTVINKVWAMGNFPHENIVVHSNLRTAYQGADSSIGYLYKFVANTPGNLHSGLLYVYSGSKNGAGNWLLIDNTTAEERNSTLSQSSAVGATVFNGIEDVEIGLDGMVYFAVKGEKKVYRFQDSDPLIGTTLTMETYVGDMTYSIYHDGGVTNTPWGLGNDNLAFDNLGNLWVFQDGGNNYMWLVEPDHTQANPKVKVFGISPIGSEPTGITFTPDFKYLFMSIQSPSATNNANQTDASGVSIDFDKDITLVIALNQNLGSTLGLIEEIAPISKVYPNPINKKNKKITIEHEKIKSLELFSINGQLLNRKKYRNKNKVDWIIPNLMPGVYFLKINKSVIKKIIME